MLRPVSVLAVAAFSAAALSACSTDAPRNTAGQVTASASADAFSIKVGDCTGKMASGTITGADLIPCADPHYFEAFAAKQMDDASYPGQTETEKLADEFCGEAFADYVGISSSKSKYGVFYLYPTTETWAKLGDREILCLAGDENGGVKGSIRGSKK